MLFLLFYHGNLIYLFDFLLSAYKSNGSNAAYAHEYLLESAIDKITLIPFLCSSLGILLGSETWIHPIATNSIPPQSCSSHLSTFDLFVTGPFRFLPETS